MRHRSLLCAIALSLAAGCASDDVSLETMSAEALFARAEALATKGEIEDAAEAFSEVERIHPYSDYARRALIASAEMHYSVNDYDEAIGAAERFVRLFPADAQTARARNVIAQSYYEQITDTQRDQSVTEQALNALRELERLHPDSEYATPARRKLLFIHSHLAGKEMEIGRYYLARGNYGGAISRFKTVLDRYSTTVHVEEALHRLVEAHASLGLLDEARRYALLLGHNRPGSPWYADSYALLQALGSGARESGKPPPAAPAPSGSL